MCDVIILNHVTYFALLKIELRPTKRQWYEFYFEGKICQYDNIS